MKKYLSVLAVAAMAAYATSAFAQGTVVFANNTGLVKQWTSVSDQTLISVPKGGGFVQLAYAPAGTKATAWDPQSPISATAWLAANPGWTLAPAAAGFTTPAAGKFNGGTITLSGIAAGANADFVTFGWAGTAATFDAALAANGLIGVSPVFSSATGGAGTPPSTAVNLNAVFPGMTLTSTVPEPGTFALAGLGAAALLIFRRRK